MTSTNRPIRRALISVFDKTGVTDLARGLHEAGVQIVSSGGSSTAMSEVGIPVTPVQEVTGFPEVLGGRVKTLHPRIHAGILADQNDPEHLAQLAEHEVEPFDLVVVNLYPFAQTVASGADRAAIIEKIDIGGPAMVRAAAKNHGSVAVVTDPADYDQVVAAAGAGLDGPTRRSLAAKAFAHTAAYDAQIAAWMGEQTHSEAALQQGQNQAAETPVDLDPADQVGPDATFPSVLIRTWGLKDVLRYGENPHQEAAVYLNHQPPRQGVAGAEQLHGKAMSFNNYVDADAAWRAAHDHGNQPTVAVIKHANPCGIAVGRDIAEAHRKAHASDPVSAYGGVVAANRPVTAELASGLKDIFTEVVIAPGFDSAALEILRAKKNIRLLVATGGQPELELRPISGGALAQQRDLVDAQVYQDSEIVGGDDPATWQLAAGSAADERTLADLQFAWRAVRATKSNAILLALEGASVGVGMGQVNRVDSCHLAVRRAGAERAQGSVAASDAFFPFADGLQVLLDAGVRAVVQPGGSIRDAEVVAAAQRAGVSMYLTGTRHFAH